VNVGGMLQGQGCRVQGFVASLPIFLHGSDKEITQSLCFRIEAD